MDQPEKPNHFVKARDLLERLERQETPYGSVSVEATATLALTHAVLAVANEVNQLKLTVQQSSGQRAFGG